MKLPSLHIGDFEVPVPIIQGGMGIGVSLSRLAAAVANAGGIGIISGANPGYREPDFRTDNESANVRGLEKEIRKARELAPSGVIGVNIMVATSNFKDMVLTAVREKVDLIISGAGLPTALPELVKDSSTKIAPIVSSGKAAATIARLWDRKYSYLPDAVIVEGPEAGGHLGFSVEDLQPENKPTLSQIVTDVINALKPFEEQYQRKVPVIAAGGVYTGADIAHFLQLGAAGVQMATRFVATFECDASDAFKQAYINAKEEAVRIIKSPVGMPGRALQNAFLQRLESGREPVKRCYHCLKHCDPATTPYCITDALVRSVTGDTENGLIFAGTNAWRINSIVSVKELIDELVSEAELSLNAASPAL